MEYAELDPDGIIFFLFSFIIWRILFLFLFLFIGIILQRSLVTAISNRICRGCSSGKIKAKNKIIC